MQQPVAGKPTGQPSSPVSAGSSPGSVHPAFTGVEAGMSAVGDIFEAIARRAGTDGQATLAQGLEAYRPGQTGLLRLTWDNGDRTVLVNSDLAGITLGWRLTHTAQDELFAAIEGTAFHTRIILRAHGRARRPHRPRHQRRRHPPAQRHVLNQVYANVLGKPVVVPDGIPTSLGSGIFAMLAAGIYASLEEAQASPLPPHPHLCPSTRLRS